MRTFLLAGIFLAVFNIHLAAQCVFPLATPANGACTGTTATSGITIGSGQTFSYSGSGGTFASLTISSNGTFQVCGSLTITNLNFNGGNIVIMSGGSLTIPGSLTINGGCQLTNYGTLIVNGNASVQGATSALVNASSTAVINLGANSLTLNSGAGETKLYNLGTVNLGSLTVNGSSQICLGPNSAIAAVNISNNSPLSVSVLPANSVGCIRYTGSAVTNSVLTASSDLEICQGTGSTSSGGGGFGGATVLPNCSSCSAGTLPVLISAFTASTSDQECHLTWTTSLEENVAGFGVEQSKDGQDFKQVGFVNANNTPSTYTYFCFLSQNSYFRLRLQDLDGRSVYSKVLLVNYSGTTRESIILSPNPSTGDQLKVKIWSQTSREGQLIINDFSGKLVQKTPVQLVQGENELLISTGRQSSGVYSLYFTSNNKRIGPVKWIKQN